MEELTVLNVNVPAVPPGQVRGSRWAKVDEFGHFNVASQSQGGTVLDLGVRDRHRTPIPILTPRCRVRTLDSVEHRVGIPGDHGRHQPRVDIDVRPAEVRRV